MLSDVTDVFPTIAELAGIDIAKYQLNLTGKSFAKNILNQSYFRPNKIVYNYANSGWPPSNIPWSPKGVNNEYLPLENNKSLVDYDSQIISVIKGDYKLLKKPSTEEGNISDKDGYVLILIKDDTLEKHNISNENKALFLSMKEILKDKQGSINNSKKAFKPIVFKISKNSSNEVLLFAPSKIGGDLNIAYNFSFPWNTKNCFADYKIKCDSAYISNPIITKKGSAIGTIYTLEINGIKSKSISQNNSQIIFEKIKIPEGESTIRVSITTVKEITNELQFEKLLLNKAN